MIKILTCLCNISFLETSDIEFEKNISFECSRSKEDKHKVFATIFSVCKHNMTGFSRNYFALVVCSCVNTARNLACKHSCFMFRSLNWYVLKICFEEKNISKHFELIEIDKHLFEKIAGDVIFHYDRKQQRQVTFS